MEVSFIPGLLVKSTTSSHKPRSWSVHSLPELGSHLTKTWRSRANGKVSRGHITENHHTPGFSRGAILRHGLTVYILGAFGSNQGLFQTCAEENDPFGARPCAFDNACARRKQRLASIKKSTFHLHVCMGSLQFHAFPTYLGMEYDPPRNMGKKSLAVQLQNLLICSWNQQEIDVNMSQKVGACSSAEAARGKLVPDATSALEDELSLTYVCVILCMSTIAYLCAIIN